MLNVSEEQITTCIRLSADYQIQYLKAHSTRYDKMKLYALGFLDDTNLTNLSFKQFLALLFVLVLVATFLLIVILAIPFMKLLDFVDRFKAIRKHRQNKKLSATDYDGSLNDLWYQFGLGKDYPGDERNEILQQWINTLYPTSTADTINISNRLEAEYAGRDEARKRIGTIFVSFCDALDNVVKDISNDHPLYTPNY